MRYQDMNEDEQIAEVQKLVPRILAQYGIEASAIENVNHSYNSSFQIQSNQGTYALRINLGSDKCQDEVLAEMQWLEALDGTINAPKPVRTTSNELFTAKYFKPLDNNFTAVLFHWIEGEEVGDEATNEQLIQVGQNMAKLQVFARDLKFTGTAFLPTINRTLLQSKDLIRPKQSKLINDELYADLIQAFEIADEVHERLTLTENLIPIHADLHTANIIQTTNGIAVIDFDDAGIGLPIQDLSISAFYLREDKEREKYVAEGYASILELPKVTPEDFEKLVMARALLLTNAVLGMTSAEMIEFTPTYLERTSKRLNHFFNTGEFLLSTN